MKKPCPIGKNNLQWEAIRPNPASILASMMLWQVLLAIYNLCFQ
jgi:hypothetical protein